MNLSAHDATHAAGWASSGETKPTATASTAAGIRTPMSGTIRQFAGKAVIVTRWKYAAIGSAMPICMSVETSTTS